MLFNFYRVHKYLYLHLQLRKLVPKSAGVYVMSSYKSSIRGHVGAQKARVNGVYGVNDEIVITSKLVKSIWFFCSVSNFALSKVNFIE